MKSIDLNCDLGEREELAGIDAALLEIVSSANIACGGHAGDHRSMLRTVKLCIERRVAIGAHPSYPDIAGFGRHEIPMSGPEIERTVTEQIGRLRKIAEDAGARITHIKPHGALYNTAMQREEVAFAIARAAGTAAPDAPLVGLAGFAMLDLWRGMGRRVLAEAFADRAYEADGSLRSRTKDGALIGDPSAAARQAVRIASGQGVECPGGATWPIDAPTICIHSDTPGSVAIAAAVRNALAEAGITVRAPASV
ncbi:MAG: LamB/YcsF family protein [Phycisphaerales bacterium]|nr:LamB/YcsF family protein [Phycisphaerales bacterium]